MWVPHRRVRWFSSLAGQSGIIGVTSGPIASFFSSCRGATQQCATNWAVIRPFLTMVIFTMVFGRLRFSNWGASARPGHDESGTEVRTITIDDFVQRFFLPRVDFIKMDIEGAESRALTGVADTIRHCRPRLAISAYRSLDDLVELASKISEIERSYRLYLVHHSMHSEETVLYGYAE